MHIVAHPIEVSYCLTAMMIRTVRIRNEFQIPGNNFNGFQQVHYAKLCSNCKNGLVQTSDGGSGRNGYVKSTNTTVGLFLLEPTVELEAEAGAEVTGAAGRGRP